MAGHFYALDNGRNRNGFLLLALTAVAATEDKAVEAAANAKAEGTAPGRRRRNTARDLWERDAAWGSGKEAGSPGGCGGSGAWRRGCGLLRGRYFGKDVNLAIAERLCSRLKEMGYQVIMARGDDTYIAKERRVEMANFWQADIYVSIHQNFYEDSSVAGIETWYDGSDASRDSRRLARLLHQEAVSATGGGARKSGMTLISV